MTSFDQGLRALIARGFRFQHLRDECGDLVVIVGTCRWGEFYDRVHLHDEDRAAAFRAPTHGPPGTVVWSCTGDAVSTVYKLLDLPEPHAPHAPKAITRAPPEFWLPR